MITKNASNCRVVYIINVNIRKKSKLKDGVIVLNNVVLKTAALALVFL